MPNDAYCHSLYDLNSYYDLQKAYQMASLTFGMNLAFEIGFPTTRVVNGIYKKHKIDFERAADNIFGCFQLIN